MNTMKGEIKMKKKIIFVLMLVACLLVMPNVYAATTEYPTVENITNEDTLKKGEVTVTGSGTNSIIITVKDAKFKLLADGEQGEDRPDDYAWTGLRFTMPDDATNIKIADKSETASAPDYTFDEYFGFNVAELQEAAKNKKDFSKSWVLTWGEPEENKVTITLIVKPESTTLLNKTSDEESWNETKYLEVSNQVKLSTYVTTTHATEEGLFGDEYLVDFYLPKGTKLTEKSLLAKLGIGSEYVLEDIYGEDGKTAFDFSKPLNENTTVRVYFSIKSSKKEETKAKDEENPSTSDSLLVYASLGVVALVAAMGTGLYLRRN